MYRFSHPRGFSKRFRHYYPWSLGLKSLLKPSQLPGEYTACAQYMHYSAKPITRTISALTGTHLPLGGEKQL